ncbi:ferredoxin [Bacillus fengqiuensis]|nr:ferredoxin [Bacillus fengqiuensis]
MEKRLTVGSLIQNRYVIKIKNSPEPFESEIDKTLIKVKQHNQSYGVTPVSNQLLLDCALKQNIPLEYKCRKGTCGKCMVEVLEGEELLYPPNKSELKKSQRAGLRLACQARIK